MQGEMAEWSKARAWKVRIPVKGYRGFESLSLRHGLSGGAGSKPLLMGTAERSEAHPFMPNFGASSIVAPLFTKQPAHPHTP